MSPPPPSSPLIFQRQRSNAIMSPHWRGCYSLERWKSIIDFTVQRPVEFVINIGCMLLNYKDAYQ